MSKKDRPSHPRVRRRNSFSHPASQLTQNAAQRRASLLQNNKNLAITLQETRCELSTYKKFFDESLEFLNTAKLAKSRLAQLSSAFKNFVEVLDENVTLLDFDESKWLNIKPSSQPNKVFGKELHPISEVSNEVPEEVSLDQETNCEDGNNLHRSDQVLEKEKSDADPRIVIELPQKLPADFVKNKNLGSASQTGDAGVRNENARAENCLTSITEVPKKISDLNSLQNPPPASTQVVKPTKIPRCQALTVSLKRQNFEKESSNKPQPQNKTYEKAYEESDPNSSRRKTFVIKNRNVVTVTEYTKVLPGLKESLPLSEGTSNVSPNQLISKKDKRKTFVVKTRNALEESEPATNLNNTIDEELVTESTGNVDKTRHVQDDTLKNTRKTYVKKPPLHQNDDLESPIPFPNGACTSVNSEHVSAATENRENSNQSENLKSSANVQRERSEIDSAAVKNKSNSTENSKNIEPTADLTSLKTNAGSGTSSKEVILSRTNTTDKTKGTPENLKSKIASVISPHIEAEVANVRTTRYTLTSYAEVDEGADKVGEDSSRNTLDSSESGCEVMMIEELVDFCEVKPALQTTPIRRQITKNKKKKFNFDAKVRETVAEKKKSQCENLSSETGENNAQKGAEVCQSSVGAVSSNENEVNIIEADDVQIIPEVVVTRDDLSNIQSDTGAVSKKITKRPRKIKDNQSTPTKKKSVKRASKDQNITKKRNLSADIEVNALIPLPKKARKRNVNKKKNELACFDDDAISKFQEVNKTTKVNKTKAAEKERESDFPCEKIGINTFRVQAEIHPPPSSLNMHGGIEGLNKENEKLDLQHMQVTVVLDDILKSKDIGHLNINDASLVCGKAVCFKSPLSASASNFAIDPEESIEKFRCDPAHPVEDCDLDMDAVLGTGTDDLPGDAASDCIEIIPRRRGKHINYKEKPLNRKMRRN